MGYSIYTPIASKSQENQMFKFLKKEFKHYDELIGNISDNRLITDICTAKGIYTKGSKIGFHYNSCWGATNSFEREYYYTVLNWIALKVGKTKSNFKYEFEKFKPYDPVPYISYNGMEDWPVLVKRPYNEKYKWRWVDKYGVERSRACIAERYRYYVISNGMNLTNKGMCWTKDCADFIAKNSLQNKDHYEVILILAKKFFWKDIKKERDIFIKEIKRLDKKWTKSQT